MKNGITFIKLLVILLPGIIFMILYNMQMEKKRFEPHIYTLSASRVLAAKIQGDPDITRDTAGVTLFSAGRILKLSPSYMAARHLHWNQRENVPLQDWIIDFSRMVPETAVGFGGIENPEKAGLYYERREKTEVAEILHSGRYENIPDSLKILRGFITKKGYQINGFYEEVYLVFEHIESDPGKYETLLRYQVEKKPVSL